MNEQYSNTSPLAWLHSSPDGWCWRMCQASFQLDLDEEADWTLLQRLPDWIMWDGQALFEQATPERLTSVRDGSASPNLPTPTARDWKDTGDLTKSVPDDDSLLPRAIAHHVTGPLLPTPQATDAKNFGPGLDWQLRLEKHSPSTASVLMNLRSSDGNTSSDDQPQPPPTTEDSDPSASSG